MYCSYTHFVSFDIKIVQLSVCLFGIFDVVSKRTAVITLFYHTCVCWGQVKQRDSLFSTRRFKQKINATARSLCLDDPWWHGPPPPKIRRRHGSPSVFFRPPPNPTFVSERSVSSQFRCGQKTVLIFVSEIPRDLHLTLPTFWDGQFCLLTISMRSEDSLNLCNRNAEKPLFFCPTGRGGWEKHFLSPKIKEWHLETCISLFPLFEVDNSVSSQFRCGQEIGLIFVTEKHLRVCGEGDGERTRIGHIRDQDVGVRSWFLWLSTPSWYVWRRSWRCRP